MKWGVKRRTHETKETITTLHSYCADYIYLAREFRRSESNKICPSNAAQHQECPPHPVSWALVLIQTCRAQWASNNSALHFFLNLSREVSSPSDPSAIPLCPFSPFSRDFASVRVKYYRTCPPRVCWSSYDPHFNAKMTPPASQATPSLTDHLLRDTRAP